MQNRATLLLPSDLSPELLNSLTPILEQAWEFSDDGYAYVNFTAENFQTFNINHCISILSNLGLLTEKDYGWWENNFFLRVPINNFALTQQAPSTENLHTAINFITSLNWQLDINNAEITVCNLDYSDAEYIIYQDLITEYVNSINNYFADNAIVVNYNQQQLILSMHYETLNLLLSTFNIVDSPANKSISAVESVINTDPIAATEQPNTIANSVTGSTPEAILLNFFAEPLNEATRIVIENFTWYKTGEQALIGVLPDYNNDRLAMVGKLFHNMVLTTKEKVLISDLDIKRFDGYLIVRLSPPIASKIFFGALTSLPIITAVDKINIHPKPKPNFNWQTTQKFNSLSKENFFFERNLYHIHFPYGEYNYNYRLEERNAVISRLNKIFSDNNIGELPERSSARLGKPLEITLTQAQYDFIYEPCPYIQFMSLKSLKKHPTPKSGQHTVSVKNPTVPPAAPAVATDNNIAKIDNKIFDLLNRLPWESDYNKKNKMACVYYNSDNLSQLQKIVDAINRTIKTKSILNLTTIDKQIILSIPNETFSNLNIQNKLAKDSLTIDRTLINSAVGSTLNSMQTFPAYRYANNVCFIFAQFSHSNFKTKHARQSNYAVSLASYFESNRIDYFRQRPAAKLAGYSLYILPLQAASHLFSGVEKLPIMPEIMVSPDLKHFLQKEHNLPQLNAANEKKLPIITDITLKGSYTTIALGNAKYAKITYEDENVILNFIYDKANYHVLLKLRNDLIASIRVLIENYPTMSLAEQPTANQNRALLAVIPRKLFDNIYIINEPLTNTAENNKKRKAEAPLEQNNNKKMKTGSFFNEPSLSSKIEFAGSYYQQFSWQLEVADNEIFHIALVNDNQFNADSFVSIINSLHPHATSLATASYLPNGILIKIPEPVAQNLMQYIQPNAQPGVN